MLYRMHALLLLPSLLTAVANQEVPLTIEVDDAARGAEAGHQYVPVQSQSVTAVPFAPPTGSLGILRTTGGLLLDRNHDGRCDAADGAAVPAGQSWTVTVTLSGQAQEYRVSWRDLGGRYTLLQSACVARGRLGEHRLELRDANCNGRFSDCEEDLLRVDAGAFVPLAPVHRIGDAFFDLAWDEAQVLRVSVRPAPPVTLSLACGAGAQHAELTLRHVEGLMMAQLASGAATMSVLPGRYRITSCRLNLPPAKQRLGLAGLFGLLASGRQDRSSITPCLYGRDEDDSPPLDLAAGDQRLTAGPPLSMQVSAVVVSDWLVIDKVVLVGAAGERYQANLFGAQGSGPELAVMAGDTEVVTSRLEYG